MYTHLRTSAPALSVYTLKDISASQERLCHLLSKNYKNACAICWENVILHSHPEIEISFKFIPKILMSKEYIHFFGPLCIYERTYIHIVHTQAHTSIFITICFEVCTYVIDWSVEAISLLTPSIRQKVISSSLALKELLWHKATRHHFPEEFTLQ